jgi:hypothetical protein
MRNLQSVVALKPNVSNIFILVVTYQFQHPTSISMEKMTEVFAYISICASNKYQIAGHLTEAQI